MRKTIELLALSMAVLVAGCTQMPSTRLLVDNTVVGGLASLDSGGFVYGEWLTGDIYRVNDADSEDGARRDLLGSVETSLGGARGLLGVATRDEEVFVSYTDTQDRLVVAELDGGGPRLVWSGPQATSVNLGGRLAFSPLDRLTLTIGDFGTPEIAARQDSWQGKFVSLDADRGPEQTPNIVSRDWVDPRGLAYDRGGNLWAADGSRAGRVGEQGFTGDVAQLGDTVGASGLAVYGEQEVLVCQRANKELKRYLIVDGVRLVPGRTVAENCAYDTIEQANGLITYATDTTIRVS